MSSGTPQRAHRDLLRGGRHEVVERNVHPLRRLAQHVGRDEARCDRVGRDVVAAELDRERLGEALDARLRGRVVGLPAVAERRRAREAHDAAPVRLDLELLHRLRHQERAAQVHADHGIPVVFRHLEEQVVAQDARVVDQDGRRAELVGDLRSTAAVTCLGVGDIRADTDRLAARLAMMASTVAVVSASRRSMTPTRLPSFASRSAIAAPMPRPAPVTIAVRFVCHVFSCSLAWVCVVSGCGARRGRGRSGVPRRARRRGAAPARPPRTRRAGSRRTSRRRRRAASCGRGSSRASAAPRS